MFFKKKEQTELDKAIEERVKILDSTVVDPEEDKKAIDNLKELADVKVQVEGQKHNINPNTIISALGSLVGIGLILNYEKLNVLTSKAITFVPKIFKS